MKYITDDIRIKEIKEVMPPGLLQEQLPITDEAAKTVYEVRQALRAILQGKDDRMAVVIGPCSIHDVVAARDYANRLKAIRPKYEGELLLIMRVYFEKPRTTVGWKGLINDPDLDDSFHINKGLHLARKLLLDLNAMGIPAGTEYLEMIGPQYIADLIAWGAIGARTTESQLHRELASGLSCPVGFKNGTDGNLRIAVDALRAAREPHHFLSMTKEGHCAIFSTTGNEDCHMILRGGKEPNHDAAHVEKTAKELAAAGLATNIMVDLSHANSRKKHEAQAEVCADVAAQVAGGDFRLFGVMIEGHLIGGRQDVKPGEPLIYGQSITDACLGWEESLPLLDQLAEAVRKRRSTHKAAARG